MTDDQKQVLIVEDDESIAMAVALNLKVEGYTTVVLHDGGSAAAFLREHTPDLVLLDIGLPDKTGLDLLSELRERDDTTPVIVLSARGDEHDKVAALKLGADDYVTKPFGVAELLARVAAVLRRTETTRASAALSHWTLGEVDIELDTRTVSRAGQPIALTHLEFELLVFLLRHPRRVFSREELFKRVWDTKTGSKRTVDNFVGQLRAKLEDNPDSPVHLITVRGSGYRLDP